MTTLIPANEQELMQAKVGDMIRVHVGGGQFWTLYEGFKDGKDFFMSQDSFGRGGKRTNRVVLYNSGRSEYFYDPSWGLWLDVLGEITFIGQSRGKEYFDRVEKLKQRGMWN